MDGRPHVQRLRQELDSIRAELIATVNALGPEALEWRPGPAAKTVKEQLQEIGTMETVTRSVLSDGTLRDWGEEWAALDREDLAAMLAALERVRTQTLVYLDGCTEARIETPIALPESWQQYFDGATHIEPEELLRWIAKHEYYHLGQLVLYGFLRGG